MSKGALQGRQKAHSPVFLHIICRLEQENGQVQATLSAVKVENGRAKDQLAAVKAKLKAKEEMMARAQDEENAARNRITGERAGWERERQETEGRCHVSEGGDATL